MVKLVKILLCRNNKHLIFKLCSKKLVLLLANLYAITTYGLALQDEHLVANQKHQSSTLDFCNISDLKIFSEQTICNPQTNSRKYTSYEKKNNISTNIWQNILSTQYNITSPENTELQANQEQNNDLEYPIQTGSNITPLLIEVSLNYHQKSYQTTVLQNSAGKILVSKDDLIAWNVIIPKHLLNIKFMDKEYYALDDFTGTTYVIDYREMKIKIVIPGKFFNGSSISLDRDKIIPTPSVLGSYLNYDIMTLRNDDNPKIISLNGYFDFNIFKDAWVLSNSFASYKTLGTNENDTSTTDQLNDNTNNNAPQKTVRLNSTWTYNEPEKMRTLIIGDTFSSVAMWGSSVGFGGIHIGTDFSTQPSFDTAPLPSKKGIATLPSTVDLYVNNALISRKNVDTGPFDITSIPIVNGSGNLSIVTTDILGRQEIIDIPYYASGEILKPNLHEYAIDIGFLRHNYGVDNFNYGDPVAVVKDRMGVNDIFTREFRGEFSYKQQAVGYSGTFIWKQFGVIDFSSAISKGQKKGIGELASVGFQRSVSNQISYGGNIQITSTEFGLISIDENSFAPKLTEMAFVGIPLQKLGSLSFTYTQQNTRGINPTNTSLVGMSYSTTINKNWNLAITSLLNVDGEKNNSIFLNLSRSLGQDTYGSISSNVEKNNINNSLNLNHNSPTDSGFGYEVIFNQSEINRNYQANIDAQSNVGSYRGEIAESNGIKGYRLSTTGSIALLKKHLSFGKSIYNSFAIVEVPGYKNVKVYSNNHLVGKTNAKGYAFVPNLLPYQINNIKIDEKDLPLTAKISNVELETVPYDKSGVLVKFYAKPAFGAMITLLTETGEIVPAGANVFFANSLNNDNDYDKIKQNEANERIYPVADDGLVYITDLNYGINNLQARWDEEICNFTIDYSLHSMEESAIPNLGKITCISTKNNLTSTTNIATEKNHT